MLASWVGIKGTWKQPQGVKMGCCTLQCLGSVKTEALHLGLGQILCPGVQGKEWMPRQLDLISLWSLLVLCNGPPSNSLPQRDQAPRI